MEKTPGKLSVEDKTEPVVKTPSVSDQIWEDIKDKEVQMFTLANQTLAKHVKRLGGPPHECLLRLNSSAVIVAIELLFKTLNTQVILLASDGKKTKKLMPKYKMNEYEGYIGVEFSAQLNQMVDGKVVVSL
jgi:hypothetical protein